MKSFKIIVCKLLAACSFSTIALAAQTALAAQSEDGKVTKNTRIIHVQPSDS